MRTSWRRLRAGLLAGVALASAGFALPAGQMPPNTIRLSAMMQQLAARPGFTEAFLAQVQGGGRHKAGAALLTPALVDRLRALILGGEWEKLDTFPGWTMAEINPLVRVAGHEAGKDARVDSLATAGGAPASGAASGTSARQAVTDYLDVGPYALEDSGNGIDLRGPSRLPGFNAQDLVAAVGDGVVRGDGPSALATEHADSERLAEALNRLAMNESEGVGRIFALTDDGHNWETPQQVIAAIMRTGSQVTVTDSRYFANFGHLHFSGQDVMMPFWVNTQIVIPAPVGTRPRPLLVPVSHAEYEWHIRGPKGNADVSFYFGIDGKAEFRTMDQLDQAWVMKRDAHTYTGADAVEVTRLAGEIVQTYAHLHAAHPKIPFGGYYGFGVCQDVVAAIEIKMTGKTTLFPNTADERFFSDPRDAEINGLMKRLPKDRDGRPPEVGRIFGSLPVGSSDGELRSVSIPGLGEDLIAVHKAWTDGSLERVGERRRSRDWLYGLGVVLVVGLVVQIRRRRGRERG